MSEFGILSAAASGMDAQRFALDIAARNVAAAQVSDPAHPFSRLVPQFLTTPEGDDPSADAGTGEPPVPTDLESADGAPVRITGTTVEHGVDVDAVTEMVAVLNAQRAYEADASVFDAGKRLAERTIDVGRL